ncbi:MAG TPA: YeiH family protein [Rhizobiaceae bacterium]|nr:YeiH family protein [Rhizobiaceae bacterium]
MNVHPQIAREIGAARQSEGVPKGRAAIALIPGVVLCGLIAVASLFLQRLPGLASFSPMIIAIVLGIVFRNVLGLPLVMQPGVTFTMRRILRVAIILLGLQLTVGQAMQVGAKGLMIIVAALLATFVFTVWFGRLLGVDRKLSELIAAGTSICGASAVIATNTVTKAPDEDVAYAVACVTIFGSIAMFTYPLLPGLLGLDPQAFGLWAGASIHEIAQVVAAAFQGGEQAGQFGTIAKLSRVMFLAPMVIGLGILSVRSAADDAAKGRSNVAIPWFVIGFVLMVFVNSLVEVPSGTKASIVALTTFLLSTALAAMGLETNVAKLRAKGLRPLMLGLAASLFIAGFSLVLVQLI